MKPLIIFNIFILLLLSYFFNTEIITQETITKFYSSQLSIDKIEKLLSNQTKYAWLGYVFIPIFYMLKIGVVSIALYTGLFLANCKSIIFSKIFKSVIIADMIFLCPIIIKMIWFSFQSSYTLDEIQHFMPGSVLNFFDSAKVEPFMIYIMQSINIWELIFIVLLANELKEYHSNSNYFDSFNTTIISYGSGFIIWMGFVTFMTLNFT